MSRPALRTAANLLDSQSIVRLMADPATHAEQLGPVEVIETHISWVFLTSRYAYKLKKPVRFDFVDFTTPALRERACQDEVRLNRRLAPQIYLGVVPITQDATGQLRLGGAGTTVDWVVKMRRVPSDRALDQLIQGAAVSDADIQVVATTLAAFYSQLPPLPVISSEYRRRIEDHVQANRTELLDPAHGLPSAVVRRVHAAQLQRLRLSPEQFDHRVCDGRIVEGHGDLRPEHVYLTPTPIVLDCIEFSAELRQLDVIDELCFLAMECTYLGDPRIGGCILDEYCQRSGDSPSAELLSFYLSYRACVRAKVRALRARQCEPDRCSDRAPAAREQVQQSALKYLELADRYARSCHAPLLLVVRGLAGVGKSTLAEAIATSLGAELLQTDAIRRELFGPSTEGPQHNQGNYTPERRDAVYVEMLARADRLLAQRLSVVLDGTFLSAKRRAEAASLARRHSAQFQLFHCRCPDEVARRRIESRSAHGENLSEAQPDTHERQRAEEEPDPPGVTASTIPTTLSSAEMLRRALQKLAGTQER